MKTLILIGLLLWACFRWGEFKTKYEELHKIHTATVEKCNRCFVECPDLQVDFEVKPIAEMFDNKGNSIFEEEK